jgi:polyhydroxyalkanoate synthesis regulator phasin
MDLNRKHKIVLGAAALLAAGGSGAAIAASQSGSPGEDSRSIINDAAAELGIPPSKLSDALKHALSDRVDEAVAAGRLSKAEGDELKQRIQSDEFPLFGGLQHGFGVHIGFFGDLDAAATYLGLTETELRTQLRDGKSLAQVARDHGKSVDGLVDALVAAAKERLDQAVAAGRITKAEEQSVLSDLRERIENRVEETGLGLPRFRPFEGFGFRHFGGRSA